MELWKVGSPKSASIESFEWFLFGRGLLDKAEVDGVFDANTAKATVAFQRFAGIGADGVVGDETRAVAAHFGFGADPATHPIFALPERPVGLNPLNVQQRQAVFGAIPFTASPQPGNPEAITIERGWRDANIVRVRVPQLADTRIIAAPKDGWVQCHRLASDDFLALFDKLETAGLMDRVLSFGGLWAPRFIRGSKSVLSQHAWGSAIDLNVPWNGLGQEPAHKGAKGSLADLVGIAAELGFFWGGWFNPRKDGMHFERTRA